MDLEHRVASLENLRIPEDSLAGNKSYLQQPWCVHQNALLCSLTGTSTRRLVQPSLQRIRRSRFSRVRALFLISDCEEVVPGVDGDPKEPGQLIPSQLVDSEHDVGSKNDWAGS